MITHTLTNPTTLEIPITGFVAEKVEAANDGEWHIRAEVQTSDTMPPGVRRRPIKYEVAVNRAEIAAALGLPLDTEAEDFAERFQATVTAGQLEQGIVAAAVEKVLG